MNTTRMFARSLSDAYPAERASWLELPTQEERDQLRDERIVIAICVAGLIGFAVMALCGWLPGGGV